MTQPIWQSDAWIAQTQRLLNSFRHWLGRDLIPRSSPTDESAALFSADFVVVSHGTETDPKLNYGNRQALLLWQMSSEEFLGTPSRETAEPVHREERAQLLRQTREQGYIDDYTGIRIAADGQRFQIHQAIVWNLIDDAGHHAGQAATFADWTCLNS